VEAITMRLSAHLTFDGQCRSAFLTYQRILGGTIVTMLTYGESPMASQVEPQWHGRIVHATLQLGDLELTGTDVRPQDYRRPQGFFVTVTVAPPHRAAEIFNALAADGEIRLPFQPTFWSPGFGVVIDKYSVPWEINGVEAATST
jgi:PhnB protein